MSGAVMVALAFAFLGGVGIATQAPINAALAKTLGGNITAAAISFGVGFAILLVAALAREGLPETSAIRSAPWWAWIGGALGAIYVWAAISSVGTLGVVTLIAAVILGQLLAALVLDATGAFGLQVQEIGWTRIAAVLLVLCGLILSRV